MILIARRLGTSVDALLGHRGHLPETVAEGLLVLSREAIRDCNFDRAASLLDAAGLIANTHQVDEAGREVLLQSAEVAMEQRRFSDALALLEQAQMRCESAKDLWRQGRCLLLRGSVKVRQREIPQAVPILERALALLRDARAGRDPARVETLIMLGTALGYAGDYAGAIRWYSEAATSQVAQHAAVLRGRALWGLGFVQRKTGNLSAASRYLLGAKDAFESAEELRELMRVLHNLGQLLVEMDRPKDALRHFHQALRVMERLGERSNRASIMTEIGRVHLTAGNVEDAEHFAVQASEEAKAINDPVEVAEAGVVLAGIRVKQRDVPAAIKLFRSSLAIFKERKMAGRVAQVAREFGLLLRESGANAEAASYLAMSLREVQSQELSAAQVGPEKGRGRRRSKQ